MTMAAPVGSDTLLCTLSNRVRAEDSAYPPDGTCDLLFYDSFFMDGKNDLTKGNDSLDPGARHFVKRASLSWNTAFGISFAPPTAALQKHYRSSEFYSEISNLWTKRIRHFGFVNLYRQFSEQDALAEALITLRFESVSLLEEISNLSIAVPVSLSLSLAGRFYTPRFTDPASPKDEEFGLFKPCRDFNTTRYGDPVSVVCESEQVDWKYESKTRLNYVYTFSKAEKRTLTYETKGTLTNKASNAACAQEYRRTVCDTKYHFVRLSYNLAAYDIDYDASPTGCRRFGLSSGAFNRLSHVRALHEYLQTKYTNPNKIFDCRAT
ncbi:hypothetical protein HPB50_026427 [Hyalomma asiaticum]|uniref:Uncharacterized protein n=1 Tax=Hyalomma asiaticum TaxID=266040 RepID=A0ACB7RVK1_HYAAI|nr:hypothetical protein HPB50_026427 [Hyalomma asiaticum]